MLPPPLHMLRCCCCICDLDLGKMCCSLSFVGTHVTAIRHTQQHSSSTAAVASNAHPKLVSDTTNLHQPSTAGIDAVGGAVAVGYF